MYNNDNYSNMRVVNEQNEPLDYQHDLSDYFRVYCSGML